MKISVVVPCRNGEDFLAAALTSVLAQTHPPFEVIVIDDGSTDSSAEIARQFGDPVRVISGTCGSASASRRFGVTCATGEALMFLDADDMVAPGTLEALAAVLARYPDAIARCPWKRLEDRESSWVPTRPSCEPRDPLSNDLTAWLTGWYHPPCSLLWSRSAYERSGGWDAAWSVNDDGDIVMRALAAGVPLIPTAYGCGYYRRPASGKMTLSSARLSRTGVESRRVVIEKIGNLLSESGCVEPYRAALAEAFDAIAADCRNRHPDLQRACRDAAAQYGGPLWWRATRRTSRRMVSTLNRARELTRSSASSERQRGLESQATNSSTIRHAPDVSVVVPTFNRAALLPRAIDSVLAQTFGSFEVLVIDDASTDSTPDAVGAYRDSRIRYLRQPRNMGPAAARNRGLAEARGRLIAFLDSDDEWMPEKLSLQVALFDQRSEEVGLVYTGIEVEDGRGHRNVILPAHRGDVSTPLLLENVIYGGGSNSMIRKSVVSTVGLFDEAMTAIEDYDYWLRVARFYLVDFIPEPLARYYNSDAGDDRVSLNLAANIAARDRFYGKYWREMREAGVAHLFLLESARRILRCDKGDTGAGRRLVLRALAARPSALQIYPWLPYMLLPGRVRRLARNVDGEIRRLLGTSAGGVCDASRPHVN